MLKWMDRLLYVDGFVDVARAYVLYGDFWISLPVALSAPLQLLAVVLENVGTVQHSQLGIMQVRFKSRQIAGRAHVRQPGMRSRSLHKLTGWRPAAWRPRQPPCSRLCKRDPPWPSSLSLYVDCASCGCSCCSDPCFSASPRSGAAGRSLCVVTRTATACVLVLESAPLSHDQPGPCALH